MRRTLPLIALLASQAGAVLLVYQGIREPALGFPLAFGALVWLLSSQLLYVGARIAGIPLAIRAAARVTVPALRRRVDRAVAASVVTGALVVSGSPALAGTPPSPDPLVDASAQVLEPAPPVPEPLPEPITEPIEETIDTLPVRTGRVGDPNALTETLTTPVLPLEPSTTTAPETTPDPKPDIPTGPAPAAPDASDHATPTMPTPPSTTNAANPSHTVVAGDNFWEIAASHIATTSGRDRATLTTDEIHPYWVRVCDANRDRIRSGDVNLIDPGEVVELPPV
ncbi:MAG: hypothetical protein WEA75_03730 [Acidimicrobiia bacterium]